MLPSMWSKYSFMSDQSPAIPLTWVWAMWMCESTNPGTAIFPDIRSTTAASPDDVERCIPLSDTVLRRTAQMERPTLIDDCANTRSASSREAATAEDAPSRPYRSAMFVPIPDWGVIVVGDPAPDVFDDDDREKAELVARLLEAKLRDLKGRTGSTGAEERLEQIASVLSHDLTSPMAVARAYLEDAIEKGETENLDKVLLALDRIDNMTRGLESFARTGRTVDATGPVDLGEAAETGWSMVDTGGATLEIEATESILADEHRLYQLFENLFANAVQHGGNEVTVRVGLLEGGTGFYVEDDGPGILEEKREAVFEHGYSGTEEQSGFGLSIVKGIVEAHGWEVRVVASESGGTRLEVSGVTVG